MDHLAVTAAEPVAVGVVAAVEVVGTIGPEDAVVAAGTVEVLLAAAVASVPLDIYSTMAVTRAVSGKRLRVKNSNMSIVCGTLQVLLALPRGMSAKSIRLPTLRRRSEFVSKSYLIILP
jgi:hypothetical protein